MDNKGQTLVLFVILLPIFMLFFVFVVETGKMYYEKNKLTNTITSVGNSFITKNLDEVTIDEIKNLIKENDKDITVSISKSSDFLEISAVKSGKNLFAKILNKYTYEIKAEYKRTKEGEDNG